MRPDCPRCGATVLGTDASCPACGLTLRSGRRRRTDQPGPLATAAASLAGVLGTALLVQLAVAVLNSRSGL